MIRYKDADCTHVRYDFNDYDVFCTMCGKVLFTSHYRTPYNVAKDFMEFRRSLPQLSRRMDHVRF